MKPEFRFIDDQDRRHGREGLQQQRHQGQHPQSAVRYLSWSEDLIRSDLAPAQQDVALIGLQHEISKKRNDQPHSFDDTIVVGRVRPTHAKQEGGQVSGVTSQGPTAIDARFPFGGRRRRCIVELIDCETSENGQNRSLCFSCRILIDEQQSRCAMSRAEIEPVRLRITTSLREADALFREYQAVVRGQAQSEHILVRAGWCFDHDRSCYFIRDLEAVVKERRRPSRQTDEEAETCVR